MPHAPRTEIDDIRIPMEDILKIEAPGDIFRSYDLDGNLFDVGTPMEETP